MIFTILRRPKLHRIHVDSCCLFIMAGRTAITREELKGTNAAFFVLTTIFITGRVFVHVTKRRNFDLSDFFIYFAYALFVAIWFLYFAVTDPLFRVYAVVYGESKSYATMMKDVRAAVISLQNRSLTCHFQCSPPPCSHSSPPLKCASTRFYIVSK